MASTDKKSIITEYQVHENDTGSAQVQIAILTEKIKSLTAHLQSNRKDFHSRRGLIKMVAKRKKLMNYLKKTNNDEYLRLAGELGIRI
jgi:small subunit ribosomal protein S15